MALAAELHLRQSQSLVMTPQLMQSIRLLTMTAVELEHFIDTELESNPLLERDNSELNAPANAELAIESASEQANDRANDLLDDIPNAESLSEAFDSSLENLYPDDPGRVELRTSDLNRQNSLSGNSQGFEGGQGNGESIDLAQLVAQKPTLRDHVVEQIIFAFPEAADRLIAADLGEQIDEAGYFTGDIHETAARFNISQQQTEEIFSRLQEFDPPGLFARDLADCLALQLKRKQRLDPAMDKLLQHLPALARRDFSSLTRICGVDEADLFDMLEEIRLLDPKPGTAFSTSPTDVLIPDAFIVEDNEGCFYIELNAALLPKLLVNQSYSRRIGVNKEEREFISTCMQNANWLMRALDQRATTLLTVISEIVKQQDGFLRHGVTALRPLKLADIAQKVDMHESTISRATTNKYVATPRGTFELRYFFSTAITSQEGEEAHSSEAVRHRIRQLIDAETVDNVLSDDAIVALLKKESIDIARRTVAKYREAMNIASSVARRREKKARMNATLG